MPRAATGQVVIDTRGETPTYALRFRAYGRREFLTLGSATDGWTRAKAETELANILADVRRGIWRPAEVPAAPAAPKDPTFHEFASRWYAANEHEWRPKTQLDYEWQLARHLLPFFKDHRLSQITIAEVDRYRQVKVAESRAVEAAASRGQRRYERYVDRNGHERRRPQRALSATSINKTITRLAQILEVALEYGLIQSNPAKGRRRRLRAQRPAPVWLDRAEHILALLDAADELDRRALANGGHDHKGGIRYRRALLATLVFAGLRIGELTALRWRDVDLEAGHLHVRASKTDAGLRRVDLLPVLCRELELHRRHSPASDLDAPVFASAAGTALAQENMRTRVLDAAVALANERLAAAGEPPLPAGLTPHKLRHTYASILVAVGIDPGSVMDQIGHADAAFTLSVYRHGMRRDGASRERLRTLVDGESRRTAA